MVAIVRDEMQYNSNNFSITLKKLGATAGIFFGVILLTVGAMLSTLAFFEKVNFNNTEVVLIASSFAFLGIGAHCLDLLEKERKANRS
jgi:hypothetical protein